MYDNFKEKRREVLIVKLSGIDEINDYYENIKLIGSGSYGHVYKMMSLKDNQIWAVKKTDKAQYKPKWETQILSTINHQNIIFVKELIETNNHYYMVMEYCAGGSLKDFFDNNHPLTENEINYIMHQFGEAVKYLHNHNIAHRDLKMDNLLLKEKNDEIIVIEKRNNRLDGTTFKLIDFGLSIKLRNKKEMMLEYCGTPLYMAPEMMNGKSYSKQCDIWSMGIVMFILMTGKDPFSDPDTIRDDIINFDIINKPLPEGLKLYSSLCIEALQSLLNPDPIFRRSASEFLNFPWITGKEEIRPLNVLELMRKMGQVNRSLLKKDNSNQSSESKIVPMSFSNKIAKNENKCQLVPTKKISGYKK